MLDRPVIDETRSTGGYRFELRWDPNAGFVDRATADAVSRFTALREQLGLSLDSRNGPVEFLVVTAAERPAEN